MNPESIAFQTDTHGQESNDLFLARQAWELSKQDDNSEKEAFKAICDELVEAYADDNLDAVQDIVAEIEDRLGFVGYTVIWDNGVFIYRSSDLSEEFWEERY